MAGKSKPKEPTPEERELARGYALKNLDMKKSNLWKYASPKLITHSEYGELADATDGLYLEGIAKVPHQELYNQLFLSQLIDEEGNPTSGGAITNPYIQETSQKILLGAVSSLKVSDLAGLGYKANIKKAYLDKYINQLDKKEAGLLVSSFLGYKKDELAEQVLKIRKESNIKGLEKILGEPEKKASEGGK
ncbi:MAG: hypothetical protein ACP5NZ_02320 [Nanobdellota archaeon]